MRRSAAEWLLLPLFVLPLAAGAGLCLLFRHDYRSEIEAARTGGEALAREWLGEGGRAGDFVERFRSFCSPEIRPGHFENEVRAEDGGLGAKVKLPGHGLGPGTWRFRREWPAGLTAAALADPETRLAIEGGAPPPDAALDEATVALRALAAGPDLDRLREAPLPAATKRFLVARWRREDPESRELAAAATLLRLVRDYHRALEGSGELPPGVHERDGTFILVPGDEWAPILTPHPPAPPPRLETAGDRAVRLVCRLGPLDPAADPVWSGRLEAPVAGAYAFLLTDSGRWWRDARFLRWAGPVGGGALAFLLLPTALLVSIRRRRRLDEARARFINELAHDLRTPLTSLRLYAEMLAAGRVGAGDLDRYATVMARESARLSGLLANLLDLSRLEHGKRVFEADEIDLDEAVSAAVRDFAALYPDRGDDVRVEGDDDVTVRADRTALARCLANLLDNAGKHTPAGTEVRISWERAGDGRVRLAVADRGAGVPPGERPRLFDRYARGTAAKADGVPGTGLGLSLVRELAEGMGGSARHVASEVGARFEITLPGGTDDGD